MQEQQCHPASGLNIEYENRYRPACALAPVEELEPVTKKRRAQAGVRGGHSWWPQVAGEASPVPGVQGAAFWVSVYTNRNGSACHDVQSTRAEDNYNKTHVLRGGCASVPAFFRSRVRLLCVVA